MLGEGMVTLVCMLIREYQLSLAGRSSYWGEEKQVWTGRVRSGLEGSF